MFERIIQPRSSVKASLLTGFLVMLSLVILVPISVQADQAITPTQKLVTVYDQGQKQIFLTSSNTIGEALEKANFAISKDDLIEPGLDEELVASKYNINIYRAQPVVIIDGPRIIKTMSPYQTARQIVQHAGLEFHDEDTVKTQINFASTGENTGVEYVVTRSKLVNFVFYGKISQLRTQSQTIGDFLKQKKINIAADDRVNLGLDAAIKDNMTIEIWREGKQEVVQEEELAYKTEKIFDYNRDSSYKQIKTEGSVGKRLATYQVIIKNGQEISRAEINSVTIVEPVTQVEITGMSMKYNGGGSKTDWLSAAGIPESMWGYADFIVSHESSWNPNAVNKSSGACGLAQALPCSKVPGNPYNPVDSLRWMDGYVNSRYGGWAEAYAFWQVKHWY